MEHEMQTCDHVFFRDVLFCKALAQQQADFQQSLRYWQRRLQVQAAGLTPLDPKALNPDPLYLCSPQNSLGP